MITPDQALEFCATYIQKDGRDFTIEGREWVRDQLFVPALSFKLWPKCQTRLCEKCRVRVGEYVTWNAKLIRSLNRHTNSKQSQCSGLVATPVYLTVLNLQRGAGKTLNTAALISALLALSERLTVGFVASAGKQSRTLVRENFLEPIQSSKKLGRRFSENGDRLIFDRPHGRSSYMEVLDSSHASVTGRRRSFLFFDEGRDIRGQLLFALLPSIRAKSSFECPKGCYTRPYNPEEVYKCPECSEDMFPNVPRIVITSTSGIIEGNETDWFMELVDYLEANEYPWCHLYRDDSAPNPSAVDAEKDFLENVFGQLPSLAAYADAELHNQPRRRGEDFVTVGQVQAVVDRGLMNLPGSDRQCFGYLDTSTVGELTSLVILAADEERSPADNPWQYIRTEHIAYWDPKDPAQCPNGKIDRAAVEAHLLKHMPLFPGLISLGIDVRGGQTVWASELLDDIKRGVLTEAGAWKGRVYAHRTKFRGQTADRDAAWGRLEERILSQTWRTFPHKALEDELKSLRRHIRPDNTVEIRDRNRKIRHADIAEGIAQVCFMIFKHMLRPRRTFNSTDMGKLGRQFDDRFKSVTSGLDPRRSF